MMRLLTSLLGIAATSALLLSAVPAEARHSHHYSGSDRPDRPLADWEVFGFDLSSLPEDSASLAAFRASLAPWTQLGIANRCRDDIGIDPWRYSIKVRDFCAAR